MTIGGWIIFAVFAGLIILGGTMIAIDVFTSTSGKILTAVICVLLVIALLVGMLWFFNNTASGQRALVDQKSNISGIDRTITIYTANGDVIAEYSGIIDIETADGGYVKFDFEGKRYIYYNCFVETIADIG